MPITLAFVPGHLPSEKDSNCELTNWSGSWSPPTNICLDSVDTVELNRADIYGFRIHDRFVDGQTWYFVSAHITGEMRQRLWKATGSSVLRPHAIIANGSVVLVMPSSGGPSPIILAISDSLDQAEALAYSWGAPVERQISTEIREQPVRLVSLVQLLADPMAWVGSRVLVKGFLSNAMFGSPHLYISQENAIANDFMSSISVSDSTENGSLTRSDCIGKWVEVSAYLTTGDGELYLSRVEKIRPTTPPNTTSCWTAGDAFPVQ